MGRGGGFDGCLDEEERENRLDRKEGRNF